MLLLRLKLVICTLIVATLLAAGTVGLALHLQHMTICARAVDAHEEVAQTLAAALEAPLVKRDTAAINALLSKTLEDTAIARITVLDEIGDILAQAPMTPRPPRGGYATPGPWQELDRMNPVLAPALAKVFPPPMVEHPMRHVGARIGLVQVQLTGGQASTLPGIATRGAIAAWAALTIVLAVIMYLATALVVRPLKKIRQALQSAVDPEEPALKRSLRAQHRLGGLAKAVRAVVADLQQTREKLASLSASTDFINDVVQSMADTLIVVDQQARIKTVNQATRDLLGYTDEELIGRTASLVCMADNRHMTADQLQRLLGDGSKRDHEATYFAKDGRRIPISLSGSVIRDASGECTGYVCIGTDISDRKAAEAEREQLNRKLLQTSRQAGMAEVATGVLHNVGNVLNSVNVSATVVEETLRKSRLDHVNKLAALLMEHESDLAVFLSSDDRGRVVPAYLAGLGEHLAQERERALSELAALNKHIGHIKDIISLQQSVARPAGVIETVDVRELLDDALRVVGDSLQRHNIKIKRHYAELPPIRTDKHKVLQILVNLLTNAKDAMKEAGVSDPLLTVRIEPVGPVDEPRGVRMEVTDTGIGIEPDNLTRIFTHGFTTKEQGHGFGLHASALAAKELHGSLTARSGGRGLGATFILELPAMATAEAPTA